MIKLAMGQMRVDGGDVEGNLERAWSMIRDAADKSAQIVVLRFFSGMTVEGTANAVGISKRAAESDWTFARAWLFKELKVA